jgi:hypothetical protein
VKYRPSPPFAVVLVVVAACVFAMRVAVAVFG